MKWLLVFREQGLSGPDRDIIVLATPEMARLSNWIIALVAAGGLAEALSTASGLLLVISSVSRMTSIIEYLIRARTRKSGSWWGAG